MNVFIIAAMSVDGYIARHKDEFAGWTSPADKKLFVELTKQAGVMVMGSTTARTIGRALPGRRTIVYTSQPDGLHIDGIETTNASPAELVAQLESEGASALAVCGGSSIYSQFMVAGVVNELYLTIEPVMFGGGIKLADLTDSVNLKLIEQRQLSPEYDTVLLRYSVVPS